MRSKRKKSILICAVILVLFIAELCILSMPAVAISEYHTENYLNSGLSADDVAALRKQYPHFSTTPEKADYIGAVFARLGADCGCIPYLNDDVLDAFAGGEEFGFTCSAAGDDGLSLSGDSLTVGSRGRNSPALGVQLIWSRSGSTYSVCACYTWYSMPVMRLKDIVSIDFRSGSGSAALVDSSREARLIYAEDGVSQTVDYDSSSPDYCGTGTGCSFMIDLPGRADTIRLINSCKVITDSAENTVTAQYYHKNYPVSFNIAGE